MDPGHRRVLVLGLVVYVIAAGVLVENGVATAFVRANMYDYLCFHGGAVGLLKGVNYYDPDVATQIGEELGRGRFTNVYPPLSSLMFAPLALLPWTVAKRIWLVISLIALFAFIRLLGRWFLEDLEGPTRIIWGAVGGLLLVSFYSLGHSLQVGQATMVNALLIMAVLVLADRGLDRQAAGVLSIAVFFKPTAVILVLYAALKRRWRLVGYAIAGIVVLMALSVGVLGVDIHADYARQMLWYFDRVDPGVNYQDFAAFWARLFAWQGHAPFYGNEHLVKPLTLISTAVLMLPALFLLLRKRWEDLTRGALLAEFGLLFTAVLLSQNQSAIHAYFLLSIPMAAVAIYIRGLEPEGRRFWLIALGFAASYCLVALQFGFREEALWHGLLILAASSKLYGGLILWALLLWIVSRQTTSSADSPGVQMPTLLHNPDAERR